MLPDIDGYSVCRHLKKVPKTQEIPIIFITAKTEISDEAKGFESGGVDYITKPFQMPIIKARIHTHLKLKRQKDALKKMAARLEELNQAKNKFIGIAAHDLRSPLSSVRGFANVLIQDLSEQLNSLHRECLDHIYNQSNHMLNLVNDLLDVAVIESGKLDLRIKKDNVVKVIEKCVALFQHGMNKKNIQVLTKFKEIPEIPFDQTKIAQVMDNLLSNAIKFSPKNGTIIINVHNLTDKIRIDVIDQGPGIPVENQPNIFGTFQKFENKKASKEKSTGLGLSIVKRIIEAHNGAIRVLSDPKSGTTMSFTLPSHI